jgi:lysozyme
MSQQGISLIKKYEGFRAKAYLCPAGVPTIGYGETRNVRLGMTITEAEASAKLESRYEEFENGVLKLVHRSLNANQLAALVSFAYNLGLGSLQSSTLLVKVNKGDFSGTAKEFSKWVYGKVNGKATVLPGLVERRKAESALFLSPVKL